MDQLLLAPTVTLRRISPVGDGSHYFYGYYDNPALTPDDRLHLCNRVGFMDRLPRPEDLCELGWLDLRDNQFHVFAQTNAWNFQQGCMLQWNPANPEEAIYNTWEETHYGCTIHNVHTGAKRKLDYPVANVSADGRWGLSINFNRVYDFRPGYGYCNRKDPWFTVAIPEDDGVILVDMQNNTAKQIISYRQLAEIYNCAPELQGAKIVINHITFHPASKRFLFLVRYFPKEGGMWKTGIGTSDLEGNIYCLRPYTYASHYFWKDDQTLLIHADCGEGAGLYELTDLSQDYKLYDRDFFHEDIHCSYSPDRAFILGDGYPDAARYRSLYLYHIATRKGMLLGKFYAPLLTPEDLRSDLHCRWNHAGTHITLDSIHEGDRALYEMDLRDAMASLRG